MALPILFTNNNTTKFHIYLEVSLRIINLLSFTDNKKKAPREDIAYPLIRLVL